MEKKVLQIVHSALVNAHDNLYRAKLQFGNMTEAELTEKYGESGHTCEDILSGYQNEKDEIERCKVWVENVGHT